MTRAVQFAAYGGPERLTITDVEPLTPGPGQVRLRVKTAGVNPVDWKILAGYLHEIMPLQFPAGLGGDVAGVVDQIGDGVTALSVGDEVLGTALTPSYAESALADPATLLVKPAQLSWDVAGGLAGAGNTAWGSLERLDVKAGETLLIHAAAGGVGLIAGQIAVSRGVTVIGTASEKNHDLLTSVGITPVTYGEGLRSRIRAVAHDGVDAVLDGSGRGEIPLSIDLAGSPERVLTLVAYDAADQGIQLYAAPQGLGTRALEEIVALIATGKLQLPVWKTYPLDQVVSALEASAAGHLSGKIVLSVG